MMAHDSGSSTLRGISKNSAQHIIGVGIGAMVTFTFKTVVGFETSAVLLVVEALPFATIVNVYIEDSVFVAMVGGDGGVERTIS